MTLLYDTISKVRELVLAEPAVAAIIRDRLYPFSGTKGSVYPMGSININSIAIPKTHSGQQGVWAMKAEVSLYALDRQEVVNLAEAFIRASIKIRAARVGTDYLITQVFLDSAMSGDAFIDDTKQASKDWIFSFRVLLDINVESLV